MEYQTTDLSLATIFSLYGKAMLGIERTIKNNRDMMIFVFADKESDTLTCTNLASDYYTHKLSVDPFAYHTRSRDLKAALHEQMRQL